MFKNIKKYTAVAITAIGLSSCENLVKDLDVSPNSPLNAPPNLILTGAQLGNAQFHEGEVARLAGMWCGYFTGADRQYVSLYEYNTNAGDFDNGWSPIYPSVVQQARIIQRESAKTNNKLMVGIGKVLEAHVIGVASSLWGDVPFKEAAQLEKYTQPKFEPQLDVYAQLQTLLTGAIDDLKTATVNATTDPGVSDVYFGGGTAGRNKWVAAAYTLKARYYMHTKEYAKAYENALLGIGTTGGNMVMTHGASFGKDFNTYYDFMQYNRPGYMTADGAFAPTLLENRNNDKTDETARLGYLYVTDNGYYEPNNYCLFDGWGATGFFGGDTSFPLVTFEENTLILAEAAARTNNTTAALANLNKHRAALNVTLSVSAADWGTPHYDAYTMADFAAGGIENAAPSIAADRALLREILEERYVTFIGQIEGFNDVRRTLKETDVRVKVTANKGTQIPQRFLCPQSEINTNKNIPSPSQGLFDATTVNK